MSRWISAKSIGKLLILLPVLLLVALACGDDATPTPTATAIPPTPTTAAGDVAPTAVPTSTVAPTAVPTATATTAPPPAAMMPEGKVVIGVPNMGNESFHIHKSSCINRNFLRFTNDPIVGTTGKTILDKNLGIAENWEMSPDGMRWTFNFRKGIDFSNGDPLTAEDAKFTLGQMMDEASGACFKVNLVKQFGSIDNIEIPDPYTMVFNNLLPSPLLIWDLSDSNGSEGFVRPQKYHESVGADEFANAPMGSGPYTLVSQRVGDMMEFEARDTPHWLFGTPKFKTVLLRIIPEEPTRIAALKAGEVDVIGVAREKIKGLEAEGFITYKQELYSVMGFYFHENWTDDSVFDFNFRKAANLAIDRDEMVEFVFGGEAANSGQYCWPAIAPGFPKDLVPYPYDPEGARAALEQSKYDGRDIIINSYPIVDVPEASRVVEVMQGQLRAVGINAEINPTEQALVSAKRRAHTLDDQLSYFSCNNRSLAAMVGIMFVIGGTEGSSTAIHDRVIDDLLDRMLTTLDDAEREGLMTEMINRVHDQYWYLHLVDFSPTYMTNKDIDYWDLGEKPYDQNYVSIGVGHGTIQ